MRRRHLLPSALAVLALGALPAAASAAVALQSVGTFDQPVAVAGAPGDDALLYVVEQRGTIQVVRGGVASEFVDLTGPVQDGGEQGLLGLAFAPDFQTSRLLYVYFTDANGDNRVEELRAPTGDRADPASRRLVLLLPHPTAANHNGGTLRFGPDGLLWLAPGDGASGANARSLGSPLGKVLRIDPRGALPGEYAIPPDNPFVGTLGARGEVWAYGLRNPFRFAFDRATGDLVIGDVGQGTTEEIDWLPAASGRGKGADLGWDVCEGSFEMGSRATPCSLPGAVLPAIDKFQDADGFRSIIAGPVVRDASLPSLNGRLVYGDYFVDALRTAVLGVGGTGSASDDREVGPGAVVPQLTSLGEDAAGCVYATSAAGPVYRLVELDARIPCALPAGGGSSPARSGPRAGGGGAGDGTAQATVSAKRRQRVLRLRGAVVRVRCEQPCRAAAGGKLHVGGRRFALRRVVVATNVSGRELRLKPRLTRRAARALRTALDAGGRPVALVRVRVREPDGDTSPLLLRRVRAIG
ncbi:MAG TPA: PQQ-dependent sugar dehydrogenase [Conexibacter sp.]|nr:PQQ-dependent sugar dehydrogenase [Conexibacter sp.]